MKFRLVEDVKLEEEVLNEDTIYRLDFTNIKNNQKEYAYIIGNRNSSFNTKKSVVDFLNKQVYTSNEKASDSVVNIVRALPDSGIVCRKITDEVERAHTFKDKEKFLNLTHRTSRSHSPDIIVDIDGNQVTYFKHHIDEIEANNDFENILGLSMKEPYKTIHSTIHSVGLDPNTLYGGKKFDVCLLDQDGGIIPKKLEITLRVI